MPDVSKSLNLATAVQALRRGELVVYPTETFYALGCDARNPRAVARLVAVKGREPGKPLPLLAGSLEQAGQIVRDIPCNLKQLLDIFWPGPLTVCLPAAEGLPVAVVSAAGEVAVRVAGHALARQLALAAGGPLVSTSANLAGEPPACEPAALSPAVLSPSAGVLMEGARPAGGAPSSIVRYVADNTLELLREGAISAGRLQGLGWRVVPPGSKF
ncbi:L-threonylcarbamoyladenylate synthase [Megalodesulfovibrio paquesii]